MKTSGSPPDTYVEELAQLKTGDFYRRMRFCRILFPNMNGNQHVTISWGDIFDELERRIGNIDNCK